MTRDLKSAYRLNEPMTLDERAEAQRQIVKEYRASFTPPAAISMPPYSYQPEDNGGGQARWTVYGGFAGQGDTTGTTPPAGVNSTEEKRT